MRRLRRITLDAITIAFALLAIWTIAACIRGAPNTTRGATCLVSSPEALSFNQFTLLSQHGVIRGWWLWRHYPTRAEYDRYTASGIKDTFRLDYVDIYIPPLSLPDFLQRHGFVICAESVPPPQRYRAFAIEMPVWFVLLMLLPLPAVRSYRFASRIMRARCHPQGCCPACGYDLRATPDRCPECGAVPVVRQ